MFGGFRLGGGLKDALKVSFLVGFSWSRIVHVNFLKIVNFLTYYFYA
jgi:hypothetical protein